MGIRAASEGVKVEGVFSLKHIIGLIWVTVMIVGLFLISNKVRATKGIGCVLKSGAVLLIVVELSKYLYLYLEGSLTLYYFPLHFCSLVLYVYPIIAFLPDTKIVRLLLPFAFAGGILAGFIALILPSNILGPPDIPWLSMASALPIISFIYHGIMIWYSAYLAYSRYYVPRYRDAGNVLGFVLFFAAIAMIVNTVFDQDFMLLRYGNGNPLAVLINDHYFLYILVQGVLVVVLSLLLILIVKSLQKAHHSLN
ncbi:MAG: YwaF family protein [Peptococcaceae bacterium]|nr:YwaF family protein [Peptococcaceae bacterium]